MNSQIIKYGNKIELRHNLDIGTSILIKGSGSEPQWIDITGIFANTDFFGGYYIGDMYNFWPNYDPDKPEEDWFVPEEYCNSQRGWTGYYSEGVICRGRLQIETTAGISLDLWEFYDLNKALADAMSNCEYTGRSEKERLKRNLIDNNYWIDDATFDTLMDNIGGSSVIGGLNRLRDFVAEEPWWRKIYYTVRASYKVYFNRTLGYRTELTYVERDVGGSNT